MRICVPVAAVVLAAGGLVAACTINSTTSDNPQSGDDAGATAPDDASSLDGSAPDAIALSGDASDAALAPAPEAFVRVAHWSPDAPAVDVCFNPAGGSWAQQTPALSQIAAPTDDAGTVEAATVDAGDGGSAPSGLTFPSVTSYLIIAPGTYGVRLVAAGATDCNASVVDLAAVTLAQNTYSTVAAVGEATPIESDQALKLVSFADDVTAPSSQISLRFINASPASFLSPADFGTGSLVGNGGPFSALFTGVAFGAAGSVAGTDAGAVDANGYLAEQPLAGATLSAHATTNGVQDTTIALDDVSVAAGAVTVALIDGVSNGSAASAAKLLVCVDQDDSQSTSLFAQCTVVSTD